MPDGGTPDPDAGGGTAGSTSETSCEDGEKNDTETGTDCGGPDCDPCRDGQGCVVDTDCESEYCGAGFICAEPSCDDGDQNANETDVDCGGDCDGCANNRMCEADDDCTSGSCESGTCECAPLMMCGAMECGSKPDGCGGMIDCTFSCGTDEMCQGNACVPMPTCNVSDCNNFCIPVISSRCCRNDGNCGCTIGSNCS